MSGSFDGIGSGDIDDNKSIENSASISPNNEASSSMRGSHNNVKHKPKLKRINYCTRIILL